MWVFNAISDDFLVSSRLFFKLELTPTRETLLHFFEQVRRAYPEMQRFRRRDDGVVVLDEEAESDRPRRYLRLDGHSLRFGMLGPTERESVASFGDLILSHSPYHLSLSPLDFDSLEVVYGFDLEFRGNHDELVAETLLGQSPLHLALLGGDARVIDCQPAIGISLNNDLTTQAYVELKSRTSMYELRTSEFELQVISIMLTIRRYFRGNVPADIAAVHNELLKTGEELARDRVVPRIVRPLREAIASRR